MNLRCDCISCKYGKQKSTEDPYCRCYNDSEYVYDGEEYNNYPQSKDKDGDRKKFKEYITNYDYIVYMDLEELAKAIDSDFNGTPWCNNECLDKCIECIIKWLKEKRDC